MKVLFVCPNLGLGGAERQWALLIPRLVERGIEAGVVTLDGRGPFFDELRAADVPAVCAGMRSRRDFRHLRRAFALVVGRPDVVVSRGVSGHVVGSALARRAGAPHVATEHSSRPLRVRQRLLMRGPARRAAAVISVAACQVPVLERLGYRRERIHVIPNGLDADTVAATKTRGETRAQLNVAERDFLAVLVGTLRPEKRATDFVRAVAVAHRVEERVRGLVVGGGPELDEVEALAADTDGAVQALGARTDAVDLIAAADAVCLTSETEAAPMALLEGMALGRPVVTTDVGGCRELVVEDETGLLVRPGDVGGLATALLRLAAEPEWARSLGDAGRARQRALFDADAMTDAYSTVLRDVMRVPTQRRALVTARSRAR